jgi:malonate-semialdehyde dehydrogenase (acetylating) / methylmalonate-semialdehyde dehydrogenase
MNSQEAILAGPVHHWIGGRVVEGRSGRFGHVFNPATGAVLRQVSFAGAEDVDHVVEAAQAGFEQWRAASLSGRSEVIFRLRNLVDANRRHIAEAITFENGKTFKDALGEVARGVENLEFACGIPSLLKGGYSEQSSRGMDVYQIRQPLGVVAGITPFNFPAMVPMWMFSNAIACGNAFILKPSEKVPSASLILAELAKDAGVPDGVLNVLHGDKATVEKILSHPGIQAISFVGSTPVARAIYEAAARAGKRVQALGGAKNHMLVLPDADLEMAADAAVSAAYGAAGERCMAISVVIAVGSVADPLVFAIRVRMSRIQTGSGFQESSAMGPLITREHRDRVASYLDTAANEGATVVVDGRGEAAGHGDGFFLGPSLIDHVKPGMRCYDDEIFGPVLSVVRVTNYEEALHIINANPYGNGATIFTQNGGAARRFQSEVEAGMVGINLPIPVPVAWYSFGGWKSSLFGDLHIYGPEGVQFYTRSKVITSRWPDPGSSQIDLGFPQAR